MRAYPPFKPSLAQDHSPILIFDTHPIQYRSPVFQAAYQTLPGLKVYYFNDRFDSTKWWFREVGQIPRQQWEIPLRRGFPNEVLYTSSLKLPAMASALRKVLRKNRPACVLIYGYYLPEHWLLRFLCAWENIPLVFVGETFSTSSSTWRGKIRTPLQKLFFSGVDQFIAIGKKTEHFYQSLGVRSSRIVSAKYCVDGSFFSLEADEAAKVRRDWRSRHGIPEDAFVLLFVGRLVERKRPFDVLALHERLCDPRVHTVLVGNGLLEHRLKEEAKDMSHVHFLGFQNQAETRASYYGSDLLLVPSEMETWGLVVNEAFVCGLPAGVTETCGVAGDLVVAGETGEVFKVGDVPSMAESVHKLISEKKLRSQWASAARAKVTEEYHVGQFAEAMAEVFRRVTGSGKSGSVEPEGR